MFNDDDDDKIVVGDVNGKKGRWMTTKIYIVFPPRKKMVRGGVL